MGFFSKITKPFRQLEHAVSHLAPPALPVLKAPLGMGSRSSGQPLLGSGLAGLLSSIPFPPGLSNPFQPPANNANAEQRLSAFVDAQGQPLWRSQLEREALLSVLRQDPSMTVDKWQRGQDMALLSEAVYRRRQPPAGYHLATPQELGLDARQLEDPSTGLRAAVFVNDRTGNYTLAFAGTDLKDKADLKNDLKNGISQAFNPNAAQYSQAIDLAQTLQRTLGSKLTDITGHSLGGGLAAAASAMTGIRATTFNAVGLNPDTVTSRGGSADAARLRGLITNYRVEGDPLTEAQEGSNIDPLLAHEISRRHGVVGQVLGDLGQALSGMHAPVQNSYISGPLAQALPDAVGTQVTLFAIGRDGHHLSRPEQMDSSNWAYLHDFDSVNRGMQNMSTGSLQVVRA